MTGLPTTLRDKHELQWTKSQSKTVETIWAGKYSKVSSKVVEIPEFNF